MEEKKAQPANSSPKAPHSEISTILQSMIKEEGTAKSPADGKTPLGNLKSILQKADASATPGAPVVEIKEAVPPPAALPQKIKKEATINPSLPISSKDNASLDVFSSGPVLELEGLIKAHRAGSFKR